MVIPVGESWQQELQIVDRVSDRTKGIGGDFKELDPLDFRVRSLLSVRYVPLIPPGDLDSSSASP
jgi:hypothetical protein